MRSAWNTRVAGCLCRSREGATRAIRPASSSVRVNGRCWRSVTMARAMRPAKRSSPYSRKIRTSSSADAPFTTSAAEVPARLMRMSRGPSCMKLKPRSESSSCGEETPRSNRMPSSLRRGSTASAHASSAEKGARNSVTRESVPKRALASAMATGSRSRQSIRPSSVSFSKIASACPPRPKVASRYVPLARMFNAASTSGSSTAVCPLPDSTIASCRRYRGSERQGLKLGRQVGRGDPAREPLVAPLVPPRFVPQFEIKPLPDEHRIAGQHAELAQVRRQEHPAMGIELQIRRVPHHQPLQPPRIGIHRGQTHQLALDLLPVRQRVDEQALILVDRDDQFPTATVLQPLAVPGWHDQAPLGIECEFVGAPEHCWMGRATHFLPLFPTECHYREQRAKLSTC